MTKIAIFALTRGYPNIDDYGALIQRNISIISHLGNKNVDHIDLLLFHEGNILSHHQSEIQRRSNIFIFSQVFTGLKPLCKLFGKG